MIWESGHRQTTNNFPQYTPFREDPHGIVQLIEGLSLLEESVVKRARALMWDWFCPEKWVNSIHQNCD